ncbi:helix-turn-helix domain-containing protein [Streptomyces sp. NPDC056353]|uniref:helix-turn-helix domain-containing protein n=1 Tax=Streptomyces TaxID=1883 RepID=UPI0013C9CAB3|nr:MULTISPECIES: helix-turn-helix transcriptional regulator [Streptomyces]MCQ4205080.1 helix-turn-helix transcriptional regulator [Streptomyces coelicoflavus]NDZ74174.1 helix-turn-helix transcriptional regulator [Streptomyces sp. SID10362]
MPVRSNPTARQLRFGAELRKLRERAGLTSTEAARLLGIKQAQVSNMETGRLPVSADRVRTLACQYECPDKDLVEALAGMTGERRRGWWEEYRDILPPGLLDLAELEHHGTALRTAHTSGIPGLLQTLDHAREVFRQVVPDLSPPEVEHRASFRLKRQAVLFRKDPLPYRAIIHEAALHMRFGGRDVTRRQLKHLLKMSEHPNISIHVIPFDAGGYPGAGQPIYYVHGPVPPLDTVQLDQSHGIALLNAEAQLDKYRMVLDRLMSLSLIELESRALIHHIDRTI